MFHRLLNITQAKDKTCLNMTHLHLTKARSKFIVDITMTVSCTLLFIEKDRGINVTLPEHTITFTVIEHVYTTLPFSNF